MNKNLILMVCVILQTDNPAYAMFEEEQKEEQKESPPIPITDEQVKRKISKTLPFVRSRKRSEPRGQEKTGSSNMSVSPSQTTEFSSQEEKDGSSVSPRNSLLVSPGRVQGSPRHDGWVSLVSEEKNTLNSVADIKISEQDGDKAQLCIRKNSKEGTRRFYLVEKDTQALEDILKHLEKPTASLTRSCPSSELASGCVSDKKDPNQENEATSRPSSQTETDHLSTVNTTNKVHFLE